MQNRIGMDTPGLSIFQGAESIHINTSSQRQEEEEEQEDRIRREAEIQEVLINNLADYEDDDDASSVNSSHFHDALKASCDHSSIVTKQPVMNNERPSMSHYQNKLNIGEQINGTSFPLPSVDNDSTISDMQREFKVHGQITTPLNNDKNNTLNSLTESHNELPRSASQSNPPSSYPPDLRAHINDEYTILENYPPNFETPSNHYDSQRNNYSNDGYIKTYEAHNMPKEIEDFEFKQHNHHGYESSPNRMLINDLSVCEVAEYNSKEQLEVLYSIRMREIQQMADKLQQLHLEKEEEKKKISRKLVLAQAEIEQSNLSRNQSQNALVDAKAKIVELQSQACSLKETISVTNKTNQIISEELSIARDSVTDLQRKIEVYEKVQSLQAIDKTGEKFLKQAQEKYVSEMKNMQAQIDRLTEKLHTKESSYAALEIKWADMQRANEKLMVEKGDTMNRLTQALEESQLQCSNLMVDSKAQENMQLHSQIKTLIQEKDDLSKTIQELQHKLQVSQADVLSYDSLLATTVENESDSIRQLKLGKMHNKSSKGTTEDITNKLRGELQRCIAGQTIKRKEITRLENTLSQKEEELQKAKEIVETCQREAALYAKRANKLSEHEQKEMIAEKSEQINMQIQKSSNNLNAIELVNETLRRENNNLQEKLEDMQSNQERTINKLHQENMAKQEKKMIEQYNKEYLEIHDKAVENVRQKAQREIEQLSVQFEQTQKELHRVKELYIDVCGTKEKLINEHKSEIKKIKDTYAHLKSQKTDIDYLKNELEIQLKIVSRLSHECESYKKIIIKLEKDLSYERKKKAEYSKKVHNEIEIAKEEALAELRNAHPNHQISFLPPDPCTEHSDKIAQLETDCKRLEEKLSEAVEEQRKIFNVQTELHDAKMKIAQETIRKKYGKLIGEKNNFSSKSTGYENEFSYLKNISTEDLIDTNTVLKITLENESLKIKCENLLKDTNEDRQKIKELQIQLTESEKCIAHLRSKLNRPNDSLSISQNDLEELIQYKEIVKQLTAQLSTCSDSEKLDLYQEDSLKELGLELQRKEAQLQRLKNLDEIKNERDQLVKRLKNQAKHFEQYANSQKQIQAELNLSPRTPLEGINFQKLREMSTKEVREEMEHKVAEELRVIDDRHREKQNCIEEKYKAVLTELNVQYSEKTKKVIHAERIKLHLSFKKQEQIFAQLFEGKLEEYERELSMQKYRTEELQTLLKQKENEIEEEKNDMAQVMSEWVNEMQTMKDEEIEMQKQIEELKEIEERLINEIQTLKDQGSETKESIDILQRKYQAAKTTAANYKKYADNKEKHLTSECRRIEEGYQKVFNEFNRKLNDIVDMQEREVNEKVVQMQRKYEEQMQKLRHKMKYRDKS